MAAKKKSAKQGSEADLVTVSDAAKHRNVTRARIHQWISEGRLRSEVRFGRTVVYLSEVIALQLLPRGRPKRATGE